MVFNSKTFTSDNKWFNKYSVTEKLYGFSCLSLLAGCIIIFDINELIKNKIIYDIGGVFIAIGGIFLLLIIVIRPFEYEKLNGKLDENISISGTEIIVGETKYLFSDIKEIEVKILTYYGMKTLNKKIGPTYYQGINNNLSILFNNKDISTFFLISSESQMKRLQKIIFDVILTEKINFKYKYLGYIADDLKTTNEYKSFIQKLKTENRFLVK